MPAIPFAKCPICKADNARKEFAKRLNLAALSAFVEATKRAESLIGKPHDLKRFRCYHSSDPDAAMRYLFVLQMQAHAPNKLKPGRPMMAQAAIDERLSRNPNMRPARV